MPDKLICKNCPLYNIKEKICNVTVIYHGEFMEMMTEPDDACRWQEEGFEINTVSVFNKDGRTFFNHPTIDLGL